MAEAEDFIYRLKMSLLGRVKEKIIDDLLQDAAKMGDAVELHKKLASGYESTGVADQQEMRELLRANYHQNQAIITILGAIVLMVTDTEFRP